MSVSEKLLASKIDVYDIECHSRNATSRASKIIKTAKHIGGTIMKKIVISRDPIHGIKNLQVHIMAGLKTFPFASFF